RIEDHQIAPRAHDVSHGVHARAGSRRLRRGHERQHDRERTDRPFHRYTSSSTASALCTARFAPCTDSVAPEMPTMSRLRRSGSEDPLPLYCAKNRFCVISPPRVSRYTMTATSRTLKSGVVDTIRVKG